MAQGHAFLCAVMDWHSRKVLGWTLSNTMDNRLCLDALEMALAGGRKPEIFNTDQGSQFTCEVWLSRLEVEGIRVSMDGRGRWLDNVFIERLWRSLKYEEIYLHDCATVHAQRERIALWFERYNNWRPHQSFANDTPTCVYEAQSEGEKKPDKAA
jgi:putative transposase